MQGKTLILLIILHNRYRVVSGTTSAGGSNPSGRVKSPNLRFVG